MSIGSHALVDKSNFIREICGFDLSPFMFLTDTLGTFELGVSIKNG